jgi:hypothetical protein
MSANVTDLLAAQNSISGPEFNVESVTMQRHKINNRRHRSYQSVSDRVTLSHYGGGNTTHSMQYVGMLRALR